MAFPYHTTGRALVLSLNVISVMGCLSLVWFTYQYKIRTVLIAFLKSTCSVENEQAWDKPLFA